MCTGSQLSSWGSYNLLYWHFPPLGLFKPTQMCSITEPRHKACTFTALLQPCRLSNRWDCWRSYMLAVPNEDLEGDALGQQENTRQEKGVLLVLITNWWDSLEGAHDAKEKVQLSAMASLRFLTPISLALSFPTSKRRNEEDPSLALMKQNSLSLPAALHFGWKEIMNTQQPLPWGSRVGSGATAGAGFLA